MQSQMSCELKQAEDALAEAKCEAAVMLKENGLGNLGSLATTSLLEVQTGAAEEEHPTMGRIWCLKRRCGEAEASAEQFNFRLRNALEGKATIEANAGNLLCQYVKENRLHSARARTLERRLARLSPPLANKLCALRNQNDVSATRHRHPNWPSNNIGRWFEEKWFVTQERPYYVDHVSKTTHWQLPYLTNAPLFQDCVSSSGVFVYGNNCPLNDGPASQNDGLPASEVIFSSLLGSAGIDPASFLPRLVAFGVDCSKAASALHVVLDPDLIGDQDLINGMALSKLQVLKFRRAASAIKVGLDQYEHSAGGERNETVITEWKQHAVMELMTKAPSQPAGRSTPEVLTGPEAKKGFTTAHNEVAARDNSFPSAGLESADCGAGWAHETEVYPVPSFGIDSPVIGHLLSSWTRDPQKLTYVRLWLTLLCSNGSMREVPETFPAGLQLVSLRPEIKDGFLILIIPMLKARYNCSVHTRREKRGRWGLKIKVAVASRPFDTGSLASRIQVGLSLMAGDR